jgi:LmbE family N-acetylglucosaminyl deacetylase
MGPTPRIVHLHDHGAVPEALAELARWVLGLRAPAHGVICRRSLAGGSHSPPPLGGRNDTCAVGQNRIADDLLEAFERARRVLAVCAHPDDESCGLGALLALAVSSGKHVFLVTCTQGEAGVTSAWRRSQEELAATRRGELGRAAEILGIHRTVVLGYPDGHLGESDPEALDQECLQIMRRWRPDVVLAYDPLGVTGHPDHIAVGRSVLRVARRTPDPPAVLFWTIPEHVAAVMREALAEGYAGRPAPELIPVDVGPFRERQRWAVEAHASQSCDLSPQFALRLELCGPLDHLTSPQLWSRHPRRDPSPKEARLTLTTSKEEATACSTARRFASPASRRFSGRGSEAALRSAT